MANAGGTRTTRPRPRRRSASPVPRPHQAGGRHAAPTTRSTMPARRWRPADGGRCAWSPSGSPCSSSASAAMGAGRAAPYVNVGEADMAGTVVFEAEGRHLLRVVSSGPNRPELHNTVCEATASVARPTRPRRRRRRRGARALRGHAASPSSTSRPGGPRSGADAAAPTAATVWGASRWSPPMADLDRGDGSVGGRERRPGRRPGLARRPVQSAPHLTAAGQNRWVAAWITRPARPPTTVPLMRMYCRSRPTCSSIRRLASSASQRATVPEIRSATSSRYWSSR